MSSWNEDSLVFKITTRFVRFVIYSFFTPRYRYPCEKHKFLKNQPFLLVSNHHNFGLDAFFHGVGTLPLAVHIIAKSTLFSSPVLAWFFTNTGLLPIHRKRDEGALPSGMTKAEQKSFELIEAYADHLRDGKNIAIYPEGTCDGSFRVKKFKSGFARIIERAVEKDGSCLVKTCFIFYWDRCHLFTETEVVFFDDHVFDRSSDFSNLAESFEQKFRQYQASRYQKAQAFMAKSGFDITVDDLIQFHEWRTRLANYVLLMAEPIKVKEALLGILAIILYPFALAFLPLSVFLNFMVRKFAVDTSEWGTYKMLGSLALFPVYFLLSGIFVGIFFSCLLFGTGFVALKLTPYRRRLVANILKKTVPERCFEFIRNWLKKTKLKRQIMEK